MSEIYESIEGQEKLTSICSGWPSFHDAEVVSVNLHREKGLGEIGPTMSVTIQLNVEPNFYLVQLEFLSVDRLQLAAFNYQNAINEVIIEKTYSTLLKREIFEVEFCQGAGMSCSFQCRRIIVVSVAPTTPVTDYW